MAETEKKRKAKTSTAVKRKYNNAHYASVRAELPIDLVTAFKEKCKAEKIPQAQVLKDAIEKFLTK